MGSGVLEEAINGAGAAQEVSKSAESRRYFTVVTRPSYPEKNLTFLQERKNDRYALRIEVSLIKRICLANGSGIPWIRKTMERVRVQALFSLA
jgi:hypothetical protein